MGARKACLRRVITMRPRMLIGGLLNDNLIKGTVCKRGFRRKRLCSM